MGEIADMMLEGLLCECCGVYLGPDDSEEFEPTGVPTPCEDCKQDREEGADGE